MMTRRIWGLTACLMVLSLVSPLKAGTLLPDLTFTSPVLDAPQQYFTLSAGVPVGFQAVITTAPETLVFRPADLTPYIFEVELFDPVTFQIVFDNIGPTLSDSLGVGLPAPGLYNITFTSSFNTQAGVSLIDEHAAAPLPASLTLFIAGLGVLFLLVWRSKLRPEIIQTISAS